MNAHRAFYSTSLLISFCFFSTFSNPNEYTTHIDGMVGKIPLKIYWFIKKLQESYDEPSISFSNRLLLYGPPGNGKTTIARKIAELTGSNYLVLNAPSIVTRFAGSGPDTVKRLFEQAKEKAAQTNRHVIIFIDEIDAIAANVATEYRSEHKLALQQLWLELDSCKGDNRIFVIFATNHFDKLNKTFLDRFGSNIIKIGNPSTPTRFDALKMYFAKQGIAIDDALLLKIAAQTKGLSIRCLEDLVEEIAMLADIHNNGVPTIDMVWQALAQTKLKFKNNKSTDNDDTTEQRALQHTLNKIGLFSSCIGLVGGILAIILHGNEVRAKFTPNAKEQERERLQDKGLILNDMYHSKSLHLYANPGPVERIKNNPLYKHATHAAQPESDLRSDTEKIREGMHDEALITAQIKARRELRFFENPELVMAIKKYSLYQQDPHAPALDKDLRGAKEVKRDALQDASLLLNVISAQRALNFDYNKQLVAQIKTYNFLNEDNIPFKIEDIMSFKHKGAGYYADGPYHKEELEVAQIRASLSQHKSSDEEAFRRRWNL